MLAEVIAQRDHGSRHQIASELLSEIGHIVQIELGA